MSVGRGRLVAIGQSLCQSVGCLVALDGRCVGWSVIGRSLWVGRCERNAIGWSLCTRRMRLVYSACCFVLVSPLVCGRGGRVEWIGSVERVALSIFLLLHQNRPVDLGQNRTHFLSSLVSGRESQNPTNMTWPLPTRSALVARFLVGTAVQSILLVTSTTVVFFMETVVVAVGYRCGDHLEFFRSFCLECDPKYGFLVCCYGLLYGPILRLRLF